MHMQGDTQPPARWFTYRIGDTRQHDARKIDAAWLLKLSPTASTASSSLHHRLASRDLIYHPRQKPLELEYRYLQPNVVYLRAGQDRPAVCDQPMAGEDRETLQMQQKQQKQPSQQTNQ